MHGNPGFGCIVLVVAAGGLRECLVRATGVENGNFFRTWGQILPKRRHRCFLPTFSFLLLIYKLAETSAEFGMRKNEIAFLEDGKEERSPLHLR